MLRLVKILLLVVFFCIAFQGKAQADKNKIQILPSLPPNSSIQFDGEKWTVRRSSQDVRNNRDNTVRIETICYTLVRPITEKEKKMRDLRDRGSLQWNDDPLSQ